MYIQHSAKKVPELNKTVIFEQNITCDDWRYLIIDSIGQIEYTSEPIASLIAARAKAFDQLGVLSK